MFPFIFAVEYGLVTPCSIFYEILYMLVSAILENIYIFEAFIKEVLSHSER